MLEIIKFWGPVKFKYKGVETLKMRAAGFKTLYNKKINVIELIIFKNNCGLK